MIDHRRGDAGGREIGFLLHDGGQPVLRRQIRAHAVIGLPHTGADQSPVMVEAEIEQIVEIDRLMGAMEIADAEMHDASPERAGIIGRHGGRLSQFLERIARQFDRHSRWSLC